MRSSANERLNPKQEGTQTRTAATKYIPSSSFFLLPSYLFSTTTGFFSLFAPRLTNLSIKFQVVAGRQTNPFPFEASALILHLSSSPSKTGHHSTPISILSQSFAESFKDRQTKSSPQCLDIRITRRLWAPSHRTGKMPSLPDTSDSSANLCF